MFWGKACVIGAIVAALANPLAARAASITSSTGNGFNLIVINGPIVLEDIQTFDNVSAGIASAYAIPIIVALNSDGGNLIAGLTIGEAIRAKQYSTAVVSGSRCASVCAMIWLAGTKRFLANTATLGFHAAYTGVGDDARESGQANAVVGAYLSKLGLSYSAVAFATAAGPTEMQWLHPVDAQRLGITLEVLPDPAPQTVQAAPQSHVDNRPDSPQERQAKSIVAAYYSEWSRSGTDVEALSGYYGDFADFYGTSEPRDKIMAEKRKFSARWPVRHYTIKTNSVFATCSETCSVTGVVEWDVASVERAAHSVGTANFVLKIALNPTGSSGTILSENGTVLASHNDALPSVQALLSPAPTSVDPSASPAYAAGRQARMEYEAWYGGLPPGDYRAGASFWAENRSLKAPPSCSQPGKNVDWQYGCLSGRARLSSSDERRHTESDFKAGWSSL